jgi:hypothetical protein
LCDVRAGIASPGLDAPQIPRCARDDHAGCRLSRDFTITLLHPRHLSWPREEEGPLQVTAENLRESHERLFVGPEIALKSRIWIFESYLNDDRAALDKFAEQWTRTEVEAPQDFRDAGGVYFAQRSSLRSFLAGDGEHLGYVLALVKRNVLVAVLAVGPAEEGRLLPQNMIRWGCKIAERVR